MTGSLPTPCDRLAWDVQQDSDGIAVSLWSESDEDVFCASVLAPFEVSIPLGAFETADLALTLNGDDIGRVQIGVVSPPPAGDASLDAAGWSFGMCVGLCNADLDIDGSALLLVGTDRTRNVTLFRNAGSLTAAGQEAIAHALEVLGHTPLQGSTAARTAPTVVPSTWSYSGTAYRHARRWSSVPRRMSWRS